MFSWAWLSQQWVQQLKFSTSCQKLVGLNNNHKVFIDDRASDATAYYQLHWACDIYWLHWAYGFQSFCPWIFRFFGLHWCYGCCIQPVMILMVALKHAKNNLCLSLTHSRFQVMSSHVTLVLWCKCHLLNTDSVSLCFTAIPHTSKCIQR